ncbi:helix-turn-helix domain-containing protein [Streptomyces sp. NPDC048241]|uniref:helix-turn-helix domain-containing protein n=1 Tax=Streptomyces sp. NPDC048241 TaxID=3365521 RepID=UPI0037165F3D
MAATTPNSLSPEVLGREDIRRALEEHDFAAVFALAKKYGGLSQNRIAVLCGLTPGKVSTIISGSQRVTSFDVICRIADGLRIPGRFIGLAARSWEHEEQVVLPLVERHGERTAPDSVPWQPGATVGMATHLTRSDLVMDRRAVTRALAGVTIGGAALLDELEPWLQPTVRDGRPARRGRLGRLDVAELESTARAFRAWDHKFGGGLRRKSVLGQLNEIAGHLEEQQTEEIEQRLFRVMAQLAGTAATMAWDSGLQRRAQDYYRLALRASHAGGDMQFGANVLAGMARQMLYGDRAHDALELIRLAQDGSRKAAVPRVRAMLHTREAWAYAAMGRVSAFERATGQAAEALGKADEDRNASPFWITYFDEAEFAGVTGGRLLDLARNDPRGHAEKAAQQIGEAIEGRGPEARRSHALDWIGLAECHFLMGDVHGGGDHAHRAVDAAAHTRSSRVRAQLGELYPYTVGHGVPRVVGEARSRIRDLLAK